MLIQTILNRCDIKYQEIKITKIKFNQKYIWQMIIYPK
jgi:hypothetical protein